MLAYICEGISDLRTYVTVTSPYPHDRGVIGWYRAWALTSTVQPVDKLMVIKFATGMHES